MADPTGTFSSVSPGTEVWLVPPPAGAPRRSSLTGFRPTAKGLLASLEGVAELGVADRMVGCGILVSSADAPAPARSEQVVAQSLVGIQVVDDDHGVLGRVDEVILTGANDVWVIHGPLGEVLLPVIDDVVLSLDVEARCATVRLLPGLLPEETT